MAIILYFCSMTLHNGTVPISPSRASRGITESAWNLRAQTIGLEASRSTIMREMLDLQVHRHVGIRTNISALLAHPTQLPSQGIMRSTDSAIQSVRRGGTHRGADHLHAVGCDAQGVLSALEGRAVRARSSIFVGSAAFSADGGSRQSGAWVRELAPLLAEKQELISRYCIATA